MMLSNSDRLRNHLAHSILNIIFWVGFGVNLHAVANELYYKAGYFEILKFQGEYIGLVLMAIPEIYRIMKGRRERGKR